MAGTTTSSAMRVECIIFYVDPKSVGSLNFLGKERVRFPITDEHSSLAVFTEKFAEFAGLKAEAEKRGLGSCVGSISAALSCLVYPPREERLDA